MKKIILFALILGLTGCAAMRENYIKTYCNPDAAYAQGFNMGKNGMDMQVNYASMCPVGQNALNKKYREGYQAGIKLAPRKVSVVTPKGCVSVSSTATPPWLQQQAK